MKKEKQYNYFYRITNNINNHFYYGIHSTDNLDDGYMGSGIRLHYAYKKYGIENFSKDILKYFDTREECAQYEADVVNETLVNNNNCYNMAIGGDSLSCTNKVPLKDKNNNYFQVDCEIAKKLVNTGKYSYIWNGKHHTEASKEKTRKRMTSENSTNTRIWVNKNGIVKYLRKELLDDYISNGWSLGRSGYKPRKNSQGKSIDITYAK